MAPKSLKMLFLIVSVRLVKKPVEVSFLVYYVQFYILYFAKQHHNEKCRPLYKQSRQNCIPKKHTKIN